jgi:hypothetical protein
MLDHLFEHLHILLRRASADYGSRAYLIRGGPRFTAVSKRIPIEHEFQHCN